MLERFFYDNIIEVVDDRMINPFNYKNKLKRAEGDSIEAWFNLNQNQKRYIVELVEKLQADCVCEEMENENPHIPLPLLGSFNIRYGKEFARKNKEELKDLTDAERKARIREYVMSKRPKQINYHPNVEGIRFKTKTTKR